MIDRFGLMDWVWVWVLMLVWVSQGVGGWDGRVGRTGRVG